MAIDCLNSYLNDMEERCDLDTEDDDIQKITFLKEQLELVYCSKYARRYSPEMLVFAYIVKSCYELIRL